MPEYRLAETARSPRRSTRRPTQLYREGTQAKTNDDRYILSTLFFAAVLFFAGSRCVCCGGRCAWACSVRRRRCYSRA